MKSKITTMLLNVFEVACLLIIAFTTIVAFIMMFLLFIVTSVLHLLHDCVVEPVYDYGQRILKLKLCKK